MEHTLCECERHRGRGRNPVKDPTIPCTCKNVEDCYKDQCWDAPF